MRTLLPLLAFVFALPPAVMAAESEEFAAVRRADAARISATVAGDTSRLADLLSKDLQYALADGRVQTKAQFLVAVADNTARYLAVTPRDVHFQAIAPGAVAMNGIALVEVESNHRRQAFGLRFLAIWRAEDGVWRLLAYQSAALAETPDVQKK